MENIPTRDEVPSSRQVLYGIAGTFLLLYVVSVNYCNHLPPRGSIIVLLHAWPEPFGSFAGYLVSAFAFYLLGAGAVGGGFRSRPWRAYLVAALTLASLLVAGMMLYWMWIPRDLIDSIED